jgi:hypothetical protein
MAASSATTLLGACFVHDDVATHEILAVECLNRPDGVFIVGHFDETKPSQLARQ